MKKDLKKLIEIQKQIIPNFDEELFLLEEEFLDIAGVYPLINELTDSVTKEDIEKIKKRLTEEIKQLKEKEHEKENI